MSLCWGKRNDSEDEMLSMDSPMIDEGGSSGGNSSAGGGGKGGQGGVVLKKGPWTTAEDAILVEYVKKHGEGNWNAVQKYSGLSRCGKSCRLRWANHLRPNLKKGGFTPEEEKLIIELHAKMGNKWARMAAHMPGRTDNEIKNYWNTRIKRLQRAGVPLYPPELGVQEFQENQPYQNGDGLHAGDNGHNDPLQANKYDISNVMYGNLSTNQGFLPYIPPFPDFSAGSSLVKGLGPPLLYSFVTPTRSCRKRLRESEQPLSDYDGGTGNEGPQFDRDRDETSRNKGSQPFNVCFPYDPDAISTKLLPFPTNQGRQSLLNGHFSASKPIIGAANLELPSFQYPETTFGSWVTNPSLPALYSTDTFIQSPPLEPNYSYCSSPRSSGLLEALVYEAKALTSSTYPPSEKSSNSSTPADVTDCSPLTMYSTEYEGYGNPNSPYGNSSESIFSNCTTVSATRSSLEEKPSAEFISGSNMKSEPYDPTWNLDEEKNESSSHLNFLRPDAILDSCWFGQPASYAKVQNIPTDAIAALFGDDLCSDFKRIGSETASGNTLDLDSCSWKNMPPVCQMSELP